MGKARNGHFGLLGWNFWYKTGSTTNALILSRLPAVCKVGFLLLISVICRFCKIAFCICRRCWRGQAYCSAACRISARRASHRQAQRRYRQSVKGRRAHCLAENSRRQRKNQPGLKNMDDQASTPEVSGDILTCRCAREMSFSAGGYGYCHFCGRGGVIVSAFARRSYGKAKIHIGGEQ